MIYFDNAATSFPKPREVTEEVARCISRYGGNPGRGSHSLSMAAAEKVFECRSLLADTFGVSDPARVFFTLNTTHALNTVIKGALSHGDHVLISDMEHNAVYRPIYALAEAGIISYDIFPSMTADERQSPTRICARIARLVRAETRMLIASWSSNLCSATLPVREIGEFCRKRGIIFIVDGAQSAGHIPCLFDEMPIDALCIPGHKGLLGPQGCGAVILSEGFLPAPLIEGGNGVDSLEGRMPELPPERYESGTLPTPAICGLCAGLHWLKERGIEAVAEHERALYRRAREILCNMDKVKVYAPNYEGATLLFSVEGRGSEEIGEALNEVGICVRAGFHCSALGHATLGTPPDGAVRLSFGPFNRMSELDVFADEMKRII